jgi:hypothetical protein
MCVEFLETFLFMPGHGEVQSKCRLVSFVLLYRTCLCFQLFVFIMFCVSAYMDCVVFLMLVGLCNQCLCDLMLYCQFTKAVDLFVAYWCIV